MNYSILSNRIQMVLGSWFPLIHFLTNTHLFVKERFSKRPITQPSDISSLVYLPTIEQELIGETEVTYPTLATKKIIQELVRSKQQEIPSFLLKISLLSENLAFLSKADQKELTLDCIQLIKKSFQHFTNLRTTNDTTISIEMTASSEQEARRKTQTLFHLLQKMIRTYIEVDHAVVEVGLLPIPSKC